MRGIPGHVFGHTLIPGTISVSRVVELQPAIRQDAHADLISGDEYGVLVPRDPGRRGPGCRAGEGDAVVLNDGDVRGRVGRDRWRIWKELDIFMGEGNRSCWFLHHLYPVFFLSHIEPKGTIYHE